MHIVNLILFNNIFQYYALIASVFDFFFQYNALIAFLLFTNKKLLLTYEMMIYIGAQLKFNVKFSILLFFMLYLAQKIPFTMEIVLAS